MASWYTAQTIKAADKNLAQIDDKILEQLLATSRNQILALPPQPAEPVPGVPAVVDPDPAAIPEHWALGHLMQTQALAKANRVGVGDVTGPEGFTVRVYPMDFTIVNVLRPRTTRPDSLVG